MGEPINFCLYGAKGYISLTGEIVIITYRRVSITPEIISGEEIIPHKVWHNVTPSSFSRVRRLFDQDTIFDFHGSVWAWRGGWTPWMNA